MKLAYILIGHPYTGKSTFIKTNLNEGFVTISIDHFLEEYAKKFNLSYNEEK